MRSLAERLRAFEQQKARLAEAEAKLKLAEKKTQNRRLVEAGGLVAKAGLEELSAEALLGALLTLRDDAKNPKTVEQWTASGGRALLRGSHTPEKGTEPIIVVFPNVLSKDLQAEIRTAGFRYNRILRHWEGIARFEDAKKLASAHGGEAHKVTAAATSAQS
jgi:hypothetical protein